MEQTRKHKEEKREFQEMAQNQYLLLKHTLGQFFWQVSLQAVTKFCKINSSLNIPAWCVQQPTLIKVGQGLRDVTRWVGFIFSFEFGFRLEIHFGYHSGFRFQHQVASNLLYKGLVTTLTRWLATLSHHLGHHECSNRGVNIYWHRNTWGFYRC